MPTKPFIRVITGTTTPIGQVPLPMTFGTRRNYRTELIDFDVADLGLPYNAILGYPALNKFMMVTHHAYNTVKLLGSGGTIVVRGDEKDAVRSLEELTRTPPPLIRRGRRHRALGGTHEDEEAVIQGVDGHKAGVTWRRRHGGYHHYRWELDPQIGRRARHLPLGKR